MKASEKARLVAAINDINKKLDLEQPIGTKGSEDELKKALLTEANAEEGGFYEKDPLAKDTFQLLAEIGATIHPGAAAAAPVEPEPPAEQPVAAPQKAAAKKVEETPAPAQTEAPAATTAPQKAKRRVVPVSKAGEAVTGAPTTVAEPLPEQPKAKAKAEGEKPAKRKITKVTEVDTSKKIKLLVHDNPKRAGSAPFKRFALYKTGMKAETFLEKGGLMIDLKWDVGHGFIELV